MHVRIAVTQELLVSSISSLFPSVKSPSNMLYVPQN